MNLERELLCIDRFLWGLEKDPTPSRLTQTAPAEKAEETNGKPKANAKGRQWKDNNSFKE